MSRTLFKDALSPGAMAILAGIGFAFAFGVGAGMRLLQEAAGRNVGAIAILAIGAIFLIAYAWRAVSRYRRIERRDPPELAERLADVAPLPPEKGPAPPPESNREPLSDPGE